MTEIRLALSYGALMALLQGSELAFVMEGEAEVSLKLDDEAIQTLQDRFRASVLAAMPTGPHAH